MAADHKTIVSLYRETVKQISGNAEEWMAFLNSACRNYKLEFDELVLVYAQRPQARALLSYEQWTGRYQRWIRRGSIGIAVFDKKHKGKRVKYYFDIADTRRGKFSKPIPLWAMEPTFEADVIETLENSVGDLQDKRTLAQAILSASEIVAEDHMLSYLEDLQFHRTGSLIEELDTQNVEVLFRKLLTNSVAYMIMARCGIDPEPYLIKVDFDGLTDFNTSATINILGTATREITEPMLREIGSTVLTLSQEQKKEDRTLAKTPESVHNDSRENGTERRQTNEYRNGTERRLSIPESDIGSTGGSGGYGKIRSNDGGISNHQPQRRIHGAADNRRAEQLSAAISEPSPAADRRTDQPLGEKGRDERGTENQRPAALGRADEQLPDRSRADSTALQQLVLPDYPMEMEQLSFFQAGYSNQKSNPAFSVSQQVIDEVLCNGSNKRDSRLRICLNYMKARSQDENIAFLKGEFSGGGNGFILEGKRVAVWYSGEGIHINQGDTAMKGGYVLSFEETDKRIQELLSLGQYMPQDEIDRAEEYEYQHAAESFLYFYRDIEKEHLFLDESPEPKGFPDALIKLIEQLHDSEQLQKLTIQLSDFTKKYRENPDIMRWRNSRPDRVLLLLQDLAIPNKEFSSAIEQLHDITRFITQDEIDSNLKKGSGIHESKYQIWEFFKQAHTRKEKSDFLKEAYGTGGSTSAFPATDHGYEDHTSKGIELSRGAIGAPYAKVTLSWNQVAARISKLIDTEQYLNPEEKENLPQYYEQQAELGRKRERHAFVHSAVDLPPEEKQDTLYQRLYYFILDLEGYERRLFQNETMKYLDADKDDIETLLQSSQQMIALGNTLQDVRMKTCDCHTRNHASAFIKELDLLFTKRNNSIEYDLGYGHLGNGLTVWNRKEEVDGDYKTIAHIAPDRTVSYREDLPQHIRAEIEKTAATTEMNISATQDVSVFDTPPILPPVQLYRKYLDVLVSNVQKSQLFSYLRDRETDPLDAQSELADFIDHVSKDYGKENQAYVEAYNGLPMFRQWLIEDVFDRTYHDAPMPGDEISRHLSDPDIPDWIREEAARAAEQTEQAQPEKEYALFFYKHRAGITVRNEKEVVRDEYKEVALIAYDRRITYHEELPVSLKLQIEEIAHDDEIIWNQTVPIKVLQRNELTLEEIANDYNSLFKDIEHRTDRKMAECSEAYLSENFTESFAFWDEVIQAELLSDNNALEGRAHELLSSMRRYAEHNDIPYRKQAQNLEQHADLIGQELIIQDRQFRIETVSSISDEVSMRDLTFEGTNGWPIFRSEKLETVYKLLDDDNRRNKSVQSDPDFEDKRPDKPIKLKEYVIDFRPQNEIPDASPAPDRFVQKNEQKPERRKKRRSGRHRIPLQKTYHEAKNFDSFPGFADENRRNFVITDKALGHGGPKTKFQMNIAAIKTLKKIETEKRLATSEEQEILHRYVGWGGIPQAFDARKEDWHSEYRELKGLLTEKEYSSALASTLNAHYTSPVVIQAIYTALRNLGYQTGNILDPGCGVGNFQGLLPADMQGSKVYGIELDSITGRIAQQLYQKNSIQIQGYEETELPDSFFDLAVGNIPFGGFKVPDKRYDKHHFLIHDYFCAKTLDKIRPGGIIAFVTSKGTMDKRNPDVRKYIAQRAELLGAIRLPNNAFKANAGTEVTTDIIFLQKRDRQIDIEPAWVHVDQTPDGVPVNSYFAEHPEMVLGKMVFDKRMYGNETETACEPFPDGDLEEQLTAAIQNIQGRITEYERDDEEADYSVPADPNVRNYSFTIKDSEIFFRENSRMFPVELSKTAQQRVKGLVELRNCLRRLITMQLEDTPDSAMQEVRQDLNILYDTYVEKYGRIYERGNSMAFSDDSSYYLLCSLEVLNDENQFKSKADIFTKRTINPIKAVTHCETADEALAVSISERGKVDLPFMMALTDLTEEQIIHDLRGVIYRDLGLGEPNADYDLTSRPFVTEDAYLSGNVREKLQYAKMLMEKRPDLQNEIAPYIDALAQVQPEDLKASEISVMLGSAWVPHEIFQEFMYEVFQTREQDKQRIKLSYNRTVGEWKISNKLLGNADIKTSKVLGTKRINAYHILERTLNLREIKVMDTVYENGKETKVLNKNETLTAQARRDKIKEIFQEWIWQDPDRRHRLTDIYNQKFNNIRPRQYNGKHLKFHGMSPDITPRENQINAIARGIYGGNELLGHCVGAGKTIIMSAIAMEKKFLGLCSKSLIVVPNHITEQFAAEWLRLYPAANLLVTTKKDFEIKNRKRLCARIATGNYDAVIIGHSQLLKIPVSQERQERLIHQQIDEIAYGIEMAKEQDGENFTIKQLEALKKSLEEKLKKLLDSDRDDVVTFEELGIDGLSVDEAHEFKNLFFATKMRNVGGIAQTDAKKSSDLFMKCQYLDEITGSKGIVFATGTPISNSIVEMYTMQRYLQYRLLENVGLHHFDEWATTFGQTVTAMELAPEGSGYRMKTRFAKFHNLGQLVTMFRECADIVTEDMLDIPVPDVAYITEDLEPSEFQKEIVLSFAERAEKVRSRLVEPHEDNMLKITNEGRKLALDQRLINPFLPDNPDSKTNKCAENVHRIWEETTEKRSAQLVFCDLSTPTKTIVNMVEQQDGSYAMDGFQDVYNDLKHKLILKGIPEKEIAFIHDAKSETQKKLLFAKVRSGAIRVLIGSTAKMGAGTNCQTKLAALHDLDPPWRPSDLAQRLGRIKRFGNENPLVYVFRYVTKGTFDAYMFQLIENKQRFIAQIFTSKSIPQIADDIDETALSYAEIKALATGDTRVLERCNLEAELQKLRVLHSGFLSQKHEYEDLIRALPKSIAETETKAAMLQKDIDMVASYPSKPETGYPITLNGIVYQERKEGGIALINSCKALQGTEKQDLGRYRGFTLQLYFDAASGSHKLDLIGSQTYSVTLGEDIHGNLQRIDNRINELPQLHTEACRHKETCEVNLKKAKLEVQNESPYRTEMNEKTKRFEELNRVLQAENNNDPVDSKEKIKPPVQVRVR